MGWRGRVSSCEGEGEERRASALPASARAEPSCFGSEAALDDLCAAEPDADDPDMDCG